MMSHIQYTNSLSDLHNVSYPAQNVFVNFGIMRYIEYLQMG
jgi:hypothetical protein